MKLILSWVACGLVFIITGCQSQEQIQADALAGGWKITQISYSQRGNNRIDSTVTYSKAVFDFGNCKLTASNRECYGYYSLDGLNRTGVTYGISVLENQLNLIPMDQANRRGLDLTGGFQMDRVSRSLMHLRGPGGYTDSQGKFHLQSFDINLTLAR